MHFCPAWGKNYSSNQFANWLQQYATGILHSCYSNLPSYQPIEKPPFKGGFSIGGLEEIRTPDPRNANAMRSQLRYEPVVVLIISPEKMIVKGIIRPAKF